MTGSDIVTGFVTEQGDTFFYDRYATARAPPTVDASQDWTLEASGENGTHTFLQFSRNLVLCDSTDRSIKAGTTRVIWAYHEQDPPHDTALMYHGETRGARSLMLLDGTGDTDRDMPADVQKLDFRNDYAIPESRVTNYLYRGFKIPDFGGKKHVIAFEPIVQPGHESLVHHMFLYACLKDLDPDMYDGVQHLRHYKGFPADWNTCRITVIAWDVGGTHLRHYKGFPKDWNACRITVIAWDVGGTHLRHYHGFPQDWNACRVTVIAWDVGGKHLRHYKGFPADWNTCRITVIAWDVGGAHLRHYKGFPADWNACRITVIAWDVGGKPLRHYRGFPQDWNSCRITVIAWDVGGAHIRHYKGFPADWNTCRITVIAWNVGGNGTHYPENVGMSIGAPGDPKFLLMETHYNNPQHKEGIRDSSGLRLLYTSDLREHDLGFMQLGMEAIGWTQIIPPGSQSFVSVGTCYPDCLEKAMEEASIDKVNVIGVHFHAHLAARKMRIRHVRNGVELPWLGNDENFDFNFQQTVRLQEEREILKGDYLIAECTYNTTDRRKVTYGGMSTQDEMCLGHILHYPSLKLRRCKSNPHEAAYMAALGATDVTFSKAKNVYGRNLRKLLHTVTWTEELRQKFQEVQRSGQTSAICLNQDASLETFNQQKVAIREPPPQKVAIREPPPVILQPYEEPDVCNANTPREYTTLIIAMPTSAARLFTPKWPPSTPSLPFAREVERDASDWSTAKVGVAKDHCNTLPEFYPTIDVIFLDDHWPKAAKAEKPPAPEPRVTAGLIAYSRARKATLAGRRSFTAPHRACRTQRTSQPSKVLTIDRANNESVFLQLLPNCEQITDLHPVTQSNESLIARLRNTKNNGQFMSDASDWSTAKVGVAKGHCNTLPEFYPTIDVIFLHDHWPPKFPRSPSTLFLFMAVEEKPREQKNTYPGAQSHRRAYSLQSGPQSDWTTEFHSLSYTTHPPPP
ncbi:DBH-like monooxygenase protein 1 [Branchiostoma belcheri]|nr:DBH-like monooxygenase protein 1 [Branchiostoma belcheri]